MFIRYKIIIKPKGITSLHYAQHKLIPLDPPPPPISTNIIFITIQLQLMSYSQHNRHIIHRENFSHCQDNNHHNSVISAQKGFSMLTDTKFINSFKFIYTYYTDQVNYHIHIYGFYGLKFLSNLSRNDQNMSKKIETFLIHFHFKANQKQYIETKF